MNAKSEQLAANQTIVYDYDMPLTSKQLRVTLMRELGNTGYEGEIANKKVVVYTKKDNTKIILLTKAITYLGNPHPLFKKRIQIPKDWIEYTFGVKALGYEVKFLGIYHYDGECVFVDFDTESYLNHKCNNSAAHVYMNDLYQGKINGLFQKRDKNNNLISVIASDHLETYLNGFFKQSATLECFDKFNKVFGFGHWLNAEDAIKEMFDNLWPQWRQAEWPGWFLEFKFSAFTQNKDIKPFLNYTGQKNKDKKNPELFDFDIWFPHQRHFGDLKASDVAKSKSPGNDQKEFLRCLQKYGRFWYVIYEHQTIKDSAKGFEATLFRNQFIHEKDKIPLKKGKELSYCKRMKHSVKFMNMFILEVNPINIHTILNDFHQGHQTDGKKRNLKFLINKSNIDNFIIYRYNGRDGNERQI